MHRPSTTRRRGAALQAAIFRAVREELAAVGYTELSVTAIARRAGTSKPVLYRRWPNRARLVLAALTEAHHSATEPADTGTLRGDLLAHLTALSRHARELEPDAIWGLLADSARDPDLSEAVRTVLIGSGEQRQLRAILRRAEGRGEIEPRTRPRRQLTLPSDLLRSRFLLHGRLTAAAVRGIVNDVLLPLYGPVPGMSDGTDPD